MRQHDADIIETEIINTILKSELKNRARGCRRNLKLHIYERDRHLLKFLEARGIRPGARFRLLQRNYDKTLSLRTAAGAIVLGGLAAEKVWVAPAPTSNA